LSATQLAAAMGAEVIALDTSAERLKRAKEFGAARHRPCRCRTRSPRRK
jgi:D-arabinose 1-dehydrogenase-like Zn-dependent alcohol dehydrogenase